MLIGYITKEELQKLPELTDNGLNEWYQRLKKANDTSIIEVKTSHSDFLADQKKWVRTKAAEAADKQMGNFRYYLCPEGIIKEEELPENWGLLVWDGKKIRKVRSATYTKNSVAMELLMMTSIMSRIAKPQVFNFRKKKQPCQDTRN